MNAEQVEALERLYNLERKIRRHRTIRRRSKKLGLALMAPILGPLVGEWWAENEQRGWR